MNWLISPANFKIVWHELTECRDGRKNDGQTTLILYPSAFSGGYLFIYSNKLVTKQRIHSCYYNNAAQLFSPLRLFWLSCGDHEWMETDSCLPPSCGDLEWMETDSCLPWPSCVYLEWMETDSCLPWPSCVYLEWMETDSCLSHIAMETDSCLPHIASVRYNKEGNCHKNLFKCAEDI